MPSSLSGANARPTATWCAAPRGICTESWAVGMSALGYMRRSGTHAPWSRPCAGILFATEARLLETASRTRGECGRARGGIAELIEGGGEAIKIMDGLGADGRAHRRVARFPVRRDAENGLGPAECCAEAFEEIASRDGRQRQGRRAVRDEDAGQPRHGRLLTLVRISFAPTLNFSTILASFDRLRARRGWRRRLKAGQRARSRSPPRCRSRASVRSLSRVRRAPWRRSRSR